MARSGGLYLASILLVGVFSCGNPSYGNLNERGDSWKRHFLQNTIEAVEKAERLERLDRKICEMLGISYAELREIQDNYWVREKEKERVMKSVGNMIRSKIEDSLTIIEGEITESFRANNYKAPKMTNQIDYIEYPETTNSGITYHWGNAREEK